jgi:sulfate transport system substrate-binding protein
MRSLIFAMLLLIAASVASADPLHLLVSSYDPTRELYAQDFNPAFLKFYKQQTGKDATIEMSHGPSGSQARKIAEGVEADIAALSVSVDIDVLKQAKLMKDDWQTRLPNNSSPYTSTVVFLVRKGNPKGIKDWNDVIKDGVQIVCPNPKTGGGARWIYLAAWGQVVTNGGDEKAARDYVRKFYKNAVLDPAMRSSTARYVKNQGDVLIGWENEILQLLDTPAGKGKYEMVVPSSTITIEVPIAVVDANVDKHGSRDLAEAFVKFMFSPEGQEIVAKRFNRPIDPEVLKKHAAQYPTVKQFTLKDVAGDWDAAMKKHFDNDAIFDQIIK